MLVNPASDRPANDELLAFVDFMFDPRFAAFSRFMKRILPFGRDILKAKFPNRPDYVSAKRSRFADRLIADDFLRVGPNRSFNAARRFNSGLGKPATTTEAKGSKM